MGDLTGTAGVQTMALQQLPGTFEVPFLLLTPPPFHCRHLEGVPQVVAWGSGLCWAQQWLSPHFLTCSLLGPLGVPLHPQAPPIPRTHQGPGCLVLGNWSCWLERYIVEGGDGGLPYHCTLPGSAPAFHLYHQLFYFNFSLKIIDHCMQ